LIDFEKSPQTSDFTKIGPAVDALFHADTRA